MMFFDVVHCFAVIVIVTVTEIQIQIVIQIVILNVCWFGIEMVWWMIDDWSYNDWFFCVQPNLDRFLQRKFLKIYSRSFLLDKSDLDIVLIETKDCLLCFDLNSTIRPNLNFANVLSCIVTNFKKKN